MNGYQLKSAEQLMTIFMNLNPCSLAIYQA